MTRNIPTATCATFTSVAALLLAAASSPALAAEPPVEKVIVRAVTHFGFDQSALTAQEQATIFAEVSKMKNVTWQTITATGHTDSVGALAYNEKLSERRAGAVKSYLLTKGLSADMVSVAAKASNAPVAPNDTDEGRAQNRRTEIVFQGVRSTAK